MRVKIIDKCDEKKLNLILEKLEKEDRNIEDVRLVGNKIWILSYKGKKEEIEKEIKELREQLINMEEKYDT